MIYAATAPDELGPNDTLIARPVKIGQTKNVYSRSKALQTACPFRLSDWHLINEQTSRGEPITDHMIHEHLSEYRISGEWFEKCGAVHRMITLLHHIEFRDAILSGRDLYSEYFQEMYRQDDCTSIFLSRLHYLDPRTGQFISCRGLSIKSS